MKAAILCCEDAPKWEGCTYKLWGKLLEESDDVLTPFSCHQGEFPEVATCRERFDVIVVGGSHYSAYDDLPWIRQLEGLLPQYAAAGVRVVGCCFGHQILAQALGGSVGKNPSGRFVLGVEQVSVDAAAARACGLNLEPHIGAQSGHHHDPHPGPTGAAPAASGSPEGSLAADSVAAGAAAVSGGIQLGHAVSGTAAGASASAARSPADATSATSRGADVGGAGVGAGAGPAGIEGSGEEGSCRLRLRLLESHGDQVLRLPPGATLLATSGTAAHEMWALGDRCLAFQFHPELTPDLVYDKIWTALSASGRLNESEAADAAAQLQKGPDGVDSELFWKALRRYIRAPKLEPLQPAASATTTMTTAAAAVVAGGAADAAAAAANGGVQAAAALRQELERHVAVAAEGVTEHLREAAAAGMGAGTASAELLTALNRQAAVAYGRAATAAEATATRVGTAVATQQEPLKVALASLGALEAQLDRLADVVGSLEQESAMLERVAEAGRAAAPVANPAAPQKGAPGAG